MDGITGIAETYGGENPRAALEKLREQILGANALRLLGNLQPLVHGEGGGSRTISGQSCSRRKPPRHLSSHLRSYRNRLP